MQFLLSLARTKATEWIFLAGENELLINYARPLVWENENIYDRKQTSILFSIKARTCHYRHIQPSSACPLNCHLFVNDLQLK